MTDQEVDEWCSEHLCLDIRAPDRYEFIATMPDGSGALVVS